MSKELESILITTIEKATKVTGEVIDGIKVVGEKSIDFAMQQIPDIIEQLLLWKFAEAVLSLVASLFIIGVVLVGLKKWWKRELSSYSDESFFRALFTAILIIMLAFPVGGVYTSAKEIIKIKLAPKIYLIEYANKLVKDMALPEKTKK